MIVARADGDDRRAVETRGITMSSTAAAMVTFGAAHLFKVNSLQSIFCPPGFIPTFDAKEVRDFESLRQSGRTSVTRSESKRPPFISRITCQPPAEVFGMRVMVPTSPSVLQGRIFLRAPRGVPLHAEGFHFARRLSDAPTLCAFVSCGAGRTDTSLWGLKVLR